MCGRISCLTLAALSLGLLVEDFCFSYIWNPSKTPILRKGNTTVKCHPTNNVPFIFPGVASEKSSSSNASGDREQWEQVGAEDEPPVLCETDDEDEAGEWQTVGKNGKVVKSSPKDQEEDEGDVPRVRCRP